MLTEYARYLRWHLLLAPCATNETMAQQYNGCCHLKAQFQLNCVQWATWLPGHLGWHLSLQLDQTAVTGQDSSTVISVCSKTICKDP